MAPPELTADAPVAQVVDPMEVGAFPIFGDDCECALRRQLRGVAGQSLHLDEPLLRHVGLDCRLRSVGDAYAIEVRIDLFNQPQLLHRLDHRLACLFHGHPLQIGPHFH